MKILVKQRGQAKCDARFLVPGGRYIEGGAFQSKVGVGLVRSQPFNFPSRGPKQGARRWGQYETEAIGARMRGTNGSSARQRAAGSEEKNHSKTARVLRVRSQLRLLYARSLPRH